MSGDLTAAVARSLLDYDPETGELTWRHRPLELFQSETRPERECKRWNGRYAGRPAFTAPCLGYRQGRIFKRNYRAHRVIWLMMTGEWPTDDIDHIDQNKSNNRWANLRAVTHRENCRNPPRRPSNSSGHTGVCFHTASGKWRAQIGTGRGPRWLGSFAAVESAAAAYRAAAMHDGYHPNHGRTAAGE